MFVKFSVTAASERASLTVPTILCCQLIEDKPKGLWLKRIGAEYKKTYGDELSSEKLERLKTLPDIARCEE